MKRQKNNYFGIIFNLVLAFLFRNLTKRFFRLKICKLASYFFRSLYWNFFCRSSYVLFVFLGCIFNVFRIFIIIFIKIGFFSFFIILFRKTNSVNVGIIFFGKCIRIIKSKFMFFIFKNFFKVTWFLVSVSLFSMNIWSNKLEHKFIL